MRGESDVIHDDLLQHFDVRQPLPFDAQQRLRDLLQHLARNLALCSSSTQGAATRHAVRRHDRELERKHRVAGDPSDLRAEILEQLRFERSFGAAS